MSSSSLKINLQAKPTWLGVWLVSFLSLTLAALVTACGGGTSTTAASDPSVPGVTPLPITPPVVNPNTSTTVSPGVYSTLCSDSCGTQKSKEIITILIRTASLAKGELQAYVLHFKTATPDNPYDSGDPEMYAGIAKSIGSGTASIDNLTYFQNILGTAQTGAASLSLSPQGLLDIEIRGASKLKWSAGQENNLQLDTQANASQLVGRWTGHLTYPLGSDIDFSLTFTNTPTPSEPNKLTTTISKLFKDCEMAMGEAIPALGGINIFNVSFKVPPRTGCSLINQTFTGVAYVTSSPIPDKTQRLQWLAIAPDGRGVSFRADR